MLNTYHVILIFNCSIILLLTIIFNFIGRPAEISEADVYICESIYDESTKQLRELPKDGLKKYTHSPTVNQDEFYFFRRLIHPVKVGATENHNQSNDIKIVYNQHYDSVSVSC